MLTIVLTQEGFNEETNEFVRIPLEPSVSLTFEYSLAALALWESKWEQPFLVKGDKTPEQLLSFIECMCVTPDFPPELLYKLCEDDFRKVNDYMQAKRSGTTINERQKAPRAPEIISSELIYYWMTALGVPFECDKWHLSRLFNLIKIANIKNQPQDAKTALTRDDLAARRELNRRRREEWGTSG